MADGRGGSFVTVAGVDWTCDDKVVDLDRKHRHEKLRGTLDDDDDATGAAGVDLAGTCAEAGTCADGAAGSDDD